MPASDLQALTGKPLREHSTIPTDVATFSQPTQRPSTQPGAYGIQNYGVQKYLPIAEKRDLAPEERADAKKGLSQWWPKIGAGYSTPMSELLSSPTKSSIISGGIAGVLGALAGAGMRHSAAIAGLGGLGAILGGIGGFISRRQENENILDLMGRFPAGATKRDMLSDPVYQSDLNRRAMQAAARNSGGGDMLTAMMVGSAFNSYNTRRR
jgi:hypothetical protein